MKSFPGKLWKKLQDIIRVEFPEKSYRKLLVELQKDFLRDLRNLSKGLFGGNGLREEPPQILWTFFFSNSCGRHSRTWRFWKITARNSKLKFTKNFRKLFGRIFWQSLRINFRWSTIKSWNNCGTNFKRNSKKNSNRYRFPDHSFRAFTGRILGVNLGWK